MTGSAAEDATVTVNQQATQRQADFFFKNIPTTNTLAAQHVALTITAVRNNAGPNGEDLVAETTKAAFLAKTPEVFGYDADGNLTQDGRFIYRWDAENRLIEVETRSDLGAGASSLGRQKLEFKYDSSGRRIQKKVSNWQTSNSTWQLSSDTRFVYDGWNLLAEYNALSANAVIRSYVWGLDLSGSNQGAGGIGGLLLIAVSGSNYSPTYDGNGNVLGLVNLSDGTLSAEYEYDAFGSPTKWVGAAANAQPFTFSTKYLDSETGQSYYGFRYYNPSTGFWLSRDPIGEQGGANLYGMVGNNPIGNVDYLGLADSDGLGAAGGAGLGSQIVIHGNTPVGNGFYMSGTVPTNFKGSTSVLFIYQKSNPNIMYRLDYGPIVKGPNATTANVWHHNLNRVQQKLNLSVANHSVGAGATAAGRAITMFKWGGRALFVVGAASSAAEIYYAEDKQREIIVQAGGWTGAAAGGYLGVKGGAAGGGAIGAGFAGVGAVPGAAIGGFVGGLVGGAIGFWGGSSVTRLVYDTYFTPLTKEEWVVACESTGATNL